MAVRLTKDTPKDEGNVRPIREYTPVHLMDEEETMQRPIIEKVETAHPLVVADVQTDVIAGIDKLEAELENVDTATRLEAIGKLEPMVKHLREVHNTNRHAAIKGKMGRAFIKFLIGAAECLSVLLFGEEVHKWLGSYWTFIACCAVVSGVFLIMDGVFDMLKIVLNPTISADPMDRESKDNSSGSQHLN